MGKRARHNKMCLSGKRRSRKHDKRNEVRSLRTSASKLHIVDYGGEQERKLNNTARKSKPRDPDKRLLNEPVKRHTLHRTKVYKEFGKTCYIFK